MQNNRRVVIILLMNVRLGSDSYQEQAVKEPVKVMEEGEALLNN